MGRVHSTTLVGDAESHALLRSITIDSSESMEVTEANLQLLFSPVNSPPFHAYLFYLIRILKFGSVASELLQTLNLCLHFTPHFCFGFASAAWPKGCVRNLAACGRKAHCYSDQNLCP
jgi:hypothetical protein